MSTLRGVRINEGKIGANTLTDGREFGLMVGGVAVAGKLVLGQIYTFKRPSDAEAIGLNAAYDTTNDVRLYRHITEFYRVAGEGKTLNVCIVAKSNTPSAMVDAAKAMIIERDNIADVVFAFNPETAYVETLVDGLNSDVKAAIPTLQTFAGWADTNDRPLNVILECRAISDTLSALADLHALTVGEAALLADKVTLVCGQDWDYADGLSTLGKKFADVGTFLGNIASQAWNRNPGEVATQNLTNATTGKWLTGGLSNHKKYSEVYASLEVMNGKGYVFPIKYTGIAGYYWNDGHTCTPVILDVEGNLNQHTIYYGHTINMCKRALRTVFLPEVKKPIELVSGLLPDGMVGFYNAIGNDAFKFLAGKGLISDGSASTDKQSDLLIDKVLNIQFAVVPTGCVNEIVGTINLKSN